MYYLLAIIDEYDPGDDSRGQVVSTTLAAADDLRRLAGLIRYYGYTPIKDRPWHYVCKNGRLCVVVGGVSSIPDFGGANAAAARKLCNEVGSSIVGMSRIDLALYLLCSFDDLVPVF